MKDINVVSEFKDSRVYSHSEQKVGKSVYNICLITFDSTLNCWIQKFVKQELSVGNAFRCWI